MQEFHFALFADYFQFYLRDEQVSRAIDQKNIWEGEAVNNLLALEPGIINVGTVRNMTVPVTIMIGDSPPTDDDLLAWEHINECSIDVPSGRLVIAGCTDYLPGAARIDLIPGCYRARIYYAGLHTLSLDGLDGDDHYQIILWPAVCDDSQVIWRTAESYV